MKPLSVDAGESINLGVLIHTPTYIHKQQLLPGRLTTIDNMHLILNTQMSQGLWTYDVVILPMGDQRRQKQPYCMSIQDGGNTPAGCFGIHFSCSCVEHEKKRKKKKKLF